MATYYYVGAQELYGIYRIKLLLGPFKTHNGAFKMQQPVRNAVKADPIYSQCNVIVVDKNFRAGSRPTVGALDLALLNPADVIEAGRVRIRPRKPAADPATSQP